jgi:hypothetical protein
MSNSISTQMSTKTRGTILTQQRGAIAALSGGGPGGRNARNSFDEPGDLVIGAHGGFVGGTDECNVSETD